MMSWTKFHSESERLAGDAEIARLSGDNTRAVELYKRAAQYETDALGELDQSKPRTFGITAVSAAALWYKSELPQRAEQVAYDSLRHGFIPPFASDQLQSLLQTIWNERSLSRSNIQFAKGEVLFSVGGGDILFGGAPLELILRKVDEVGRTFFRTVEMLLKKPFRRRGAPDVEIQDQFRPWLFQAPAGSYQFAVRIEQPAQMTFLPDLEIERDQIIRTFLDILRFSVDDPEGRLVTLVPEENYRSTFLKLTRNLAPTGKVFERMEIRASGEFGQPIVLMPQSRDTINTTIRAVTKKEWGNEQLQEMQIRGVLRGLQLDSDWLELSVEGQEKPVRVFEAGDAIDDLVGPMVNHRVVLNVVQRQNGRYSFRDIQPEE